MSYLHKEYESWKERRSGREQDFSSYEGAQSVRRSEKLLALLLL
jgi:hypothetical protein